MATASLSAFGAATFGGAHPVICKFRLVFFRKSRQRPATTKLFNLVTMQGQLNMLGYIILQPCRRFFCAMEESIANPHHKIELLIVDKGIPYSYFAPSMFYATFHQYLAL